MNVETKAEAAIFPEKECIYGIFVAVRIEQKTILVSGKEPTSSLPGDKDEPSAGLRIQPLLPQEHLSHFLLTEYITLPHTANEGPVRIQYKCLIWNLIHSQTK
jgi:hypothetical protein